VWAVESIFHFSLEELWKMTIDDLDFWRRGTIKVGQ